MERMEIYAAAMGIKNGLRPQMVHVNGHGSDHYGPSQFPFFPEEYKSEDSRGQKMQTIMDYRLEHGWREIKTTWFWNLKSTTVFGPCHYFPIDIWPGRSVETR